MDVIKNNIYINIDKLGELVKNSLNHYDRSVSYLRSWGKLNKNGIEIVIALNDFVYGYLIFDNDGILYRYGFKNKNIEKYYEKRHGMPIDRDILKTIKEKGGQFNWMH